jgi:hypothetical protein
VKRPNRKAREPTRIELPGGQENQLQVLKSRERQEKQDIIDFLGGLGGSILDLVSICVHLLLSAVP